MARETSRAAELRRSPAPSENPSLLALLSKANGVYDIDDATDGVPLNERLVVDAHRRQCQWLDEATVLASDCVEQSVASFGEFADETVRAKDAFPHSSHVAVNSKRALQFLEAGTTQVDDTAAEPEPVPEPETEPDPSPSLHQS